MDKETGTELDPQTNYIAQMQEEHLVVCLNGSNTKPTINLLSTPSDNIIIISVF